MDPPVIPSMGPFARLSFYASVIPTHSLPTVHQIYLSMHPPSVRQFIHLSSRKFMNSSVHPGSNSFVHLRTCSLINLSILPSSHSAGCLTTQLQIFPSFCSGYIANKRQTVSRLHRLLHDSSFGELVALRRMLY
jgi:hypothetical protein